MTKSHLLALGAMAAFAVCAQPKEQAKAQTNTQASLPIAQQIASFAKTCDGDMPFRAGVAIPSNDAARPSMMGIAIGNVTCLAKPVPPEETAGHLAYLTAQLAPAHVFDQLQRTGRAKQYFSFAYKGTVFEMQQTASRLDAEMMSLHPMLCHDYNFISKTSGGQYIASGEMQVCLPAYRMAANNLPVVPLEGASQGPQPSQRRGYTEPRDKQYYGS